MRLFKLYGEGTRHLTRGVSVAYKIWRCWLHGSTGEKEQASYRYEKLRQFEESRHQGLSVRSSLAIVGVPSSPLYHWRCRYWSYGMEGLTDDNRARKTPPPRRVRRSSVVLKVLSWQRLGTVG